MLTEIPVGRQPSRSPTPVGRQPRSHRPVGGPPPADRPPGDGAPGEGRATAGRPAARSPVRTPFLASPCPPACAARSLERGCTAARQLSGLLLPLPLLRAGRPTGSRTLALAPSICERSTSIRSNAIFLRFLR
ncbi:hypothetical protein F750_5339 [Streptomyces sp. PAMC 26508]|nr:hypothetical protein F750_5339 [Streptomyces sp. PAMC 26508]